MCQYEQCPKLSKRFDFQLSIGKGKFLTQQKKLNNPIDTCKVPTAPRHKFKLQN